MTVTNPLGHTDTFTYDALGRIKTVKDKNYLINNNVTEYFYDANSNLIETVDALGNSSFFDYDAMNCLVKVTLNKIDPRNSVGNVDQFTFLGKTYWEITDPPTKKIGFLMDSYLQSVWGFQKRLAQ